MKKILKLTPFLFLMLFSLNIHSQTSEVKKLQDKIEEWNNYSFNRYVIDNDRNTIYSRYNNSGIISGVYTKWSSYSNSRYYEYIITPQSANGNHGTTVTRSITMSTPYTKEELESYRKSMLDIVFKQIDEQLELEKKQKEDRNATAQKNAERKRKRGGYVKKQKELIDKLKDNILLSLEFQKREFSDDIEYFKKVHQNIEHILSTYVNMNIDTESIQFRNIYSTDENSIAFFPTVHELEQRDIFKGLGIDSREEKYTWIKSLYLRYENDDYPVGNERRYIRTKNHYGSGIRMGAMIGEDELSVLELFSGREEEKRLRKIIGFVKMTNPVTLNNLEESLQMYNDESRWKELEDISDDKRKSNLLIPIQDHLYKLWRENHSEIEKQGLKYKLDLYNPIDSKSEYPIKYIYPISSFYDLKNFMDFTNRVSGRYMNDLRNYYPDMYNPLLMKDNVIDKWNGSLINPSSTLASDLGWLLKFDQDLMMIKNLQIFGNSINKYSSDNSIKRSDKKSLNIIKERIIEIFTPQELKIYNIIFSMYFKTDQDILLFKNTSNSYPYIRSDREFTPEEKLELYDLIQLSPIKLGDRLSSNAVDNLWKSFIKK